MFHAALFWLEGSRVAWHFGFAEVAVVVSFTADEGVVHVTACAMKGASETDAVEYLSILDKIAANIWIWDVTRGLVWKKVLVMQSWW